MIDEIKKYISIIISILIVVGIFIYMSKVNSNLEFLLKEYDKKIDVIENQIDSLKVINKNLYARLDNLKFVKQQIINKYYYEYETIKNINDYDSLLTILREQLQLLKRPKFD